MMRWFAAVLVCLSMSAAALGGETIRVAAAISLSDAMGDLGKAYAAEGGGDEVQFTFGSSGSLLGQIKNGADVDVFVSAATKQMDELEKGKLIEAGTRQEVARNELVLVVPPKGEGVVAGFADLSKSEVRKVSIGEPKTVPAGQYAMQVLQKLKLVETLGDRLVYGANVRQVLSYVERGEVDAGIVYSTDARESGDKVRVVATAGANDHEPITYPGAVVTASKKKDAAKRFLDFVTTEKGRKILAERGFVLPTKTP